MGVSLPCCPRLYVTHCCPLPPLCCSDPAALCSWAKALLISLSGVHKAWSTLSLPKYPCSRSYCQALHYHCAHAAPSGQDRQTSGLSDTRPFNRSVSGCAHSSCICAGRHGVRHRCVIPQPLPIPLPYPQRFPPGTSRHGDLPDALQPAQQLLNQPWGNQQVVPAAAETKCSCGCMSPNLDRLL